VDYHRDFSNSVASRLFRPEHKSKVPTYWQLDPHSDCYRRHTHPIKPPWGCVNIVNERQRSSETKQLDDFHKRSEGGSYEQ
jgi:hypothetical protein